ncbi:inner membrane protein YbjM [Candidatus Pantoea multigeneris]|uniref:Inner membrane protein n=1 Tax=Candidatus Pantoea multigeneris TaxID=2608357 RepID=A0ABX0RGV9_9GAMM|nr:inner membrane protein YbjM [Pantoea multigeneris]NIF22884.1 hypothetical protein [Pantoea multigeneris]
MAQQRNQNTRVFTLGAIFYTLVFICAHHFWLSGANALGGQPELLLFLLPGMLIALLQPERALQMTSVSALSGTLLAMVLLNTTLFNHASLGLISAWALSAVFWAGCGALLLRLVRIAFYLTH